MTDIERLSSDDALLLSLAKGANVRTAAAEAGISEATAFRRLKTAGFVAELNRIRGEAFSAAVEELRSLGSQCVETVREELKCGDNKAAVALRVLQMIGIEKLMHAGLPDLNAGDGRHPDEDRVAGRGRLELIERELQRLQAEKSRLMDVAT